MADRKGKHIHPADHNANNNDVYAGILSGGIGYTLQSLGQKFSPSSDAALLLSLEAVFAALFGFVFLQEFASISQLIGYALILVAIILAQVMRTVATNRVNIEPPSQPGDQEIQ